MVFALKSFTLVHAILKSHRPLFFFNVFVCFAALVVVKAESHLIVYGRVLEFP